MKNLKPLFDAAKAAEEKVRQIQQEMLDAFGDGTEEGKLKALELRPSLDEAKAASDAANLLYISARDADAEDANAAARRFVPTGGATAGGTKEITRAEYEAMDYAERHAYLKSGGAIVDNPAE